ncbi:MAG: pH regulation protein F [Candidatus Thiodiazotropha sp. (ex Codakia rugifera)]|nr:pH regulation protein F [Candidatus Thiodiazotropha sp. (ex Codakia rugifera)]
MYTAVSLAILVSLGLVLARALLGPTVYDRIAAVNMFGTKTVLLIAVLAFSSGRTDLLDIALVYALINFTGVVAVMRLVTYGSFHSSRKADTKSVTADKG